MPKRRQKVCSAIENFSNYAKKKVKNIFGAGKENQKSRPPSPLQHVFPNFDTSGLALSTLENTLGHKLDEEMAPLNLKRVPDGSDSGSNLRVLIDALLRRYPPPYTEEIQDEDNLPSQNVMDSAVNAEDWTFAGPHYDFGDITVPLTVSISSTVDTGVLNPITGVTWDTEDQDLVENHDQQGSDGENEVDEGDMADIIENAAEDDSSYDHSWESRKPPSLDEARKALADLNRLIKPLRASGRGYKECLLPLKLRTRLEWMASFLHVYISDDPKYGKSANGSRWMASSLLAAHTQQKMSKHAEKLRKWTKAFICDRDALPISPTGKKTQS